MRLTSNGAAGRGNVGIGTTTPTNGTLEVKGTIYASGALTASNLVATVRIYTAVQTNDVAGATTNTPIGLFGCMTMDITNSYVANGVYSTVTNFSHVRTNGFISNPATGYLTNTVAGYYKISYYIAAVPGNGDMLEGEININGVGREEISMFGSYDNPARIRTISSSGIMFLPANSYTCFQLKNTSASAISVWRGGITISTP